MNIQSDIIQAFPIAVYGNNTTLLLYIASLQFLRLVTIRPAAKKIWRNEPCTIRACCDKACGERACCDKACANRACCYKASSGKACTDSGCSDEAWTDNVRDKRNPAKAH